MNIETWEDCVNELGRCAEELRSHNVRNEDIREVMVLASFCVFEYVQKARERWKASLSGLAETEVPQ